MLTRLSAEESLTASSRISHGSGVLAVDARRRLTRAWSRAADPSAPPARPAAAGDFAALGIGVRAVVKGASA
jgi:hypothetical protein